MNNAMENEIAKIARDVLGLETLVARNSDDLDFSQQAVWTLERALRAAFEAGRQAEAAEGAPMSEMDRAQVERDYFGGRA